MNSRYTITAAGVVFTILGSLSVVWAADLRFEIELPRGPGMAISVPVQSRARILDIYPGMPLTDALAILKPTYGNTLQTQTEIFLGHAGNWSGVDYSFRAKEFVDGFYVSRAERRGNLIVNEELQAKTASPMMNDQIFVFSRRIGYRSQGTAELPNLEDIRRDLIAKYGNPTFKTIDESGDRYLWEFGFEVQLSEKQAWIPQYPQRLPGTLRGAFPNGGDCKGIIDRGVEVYMEASVSRIAEAREKYQSLSLHFVHNRVCLEGVNKVRDLFARTLREKVDEKLRTVEPVKPRL